MGRLKTSYQTASKRATTLVDQFGKPIKKSTPKALYDSLKPSPGQRPVKLSSGSHEDDHLSSTDRRKMIAIARDSELNFELAKGLVQRVVDFVVGDGKKLQFNTKDKQLSQKEKTNLKKAEFWYNNEFAEKDVFDGRSRHDMFDAQRTTFRRWFVDCDLIVYCDPVRNKYFHFEADQLVSPHNWNQAVKRAGWECVDGVVVDPYGTARRYIVHPKGERMASVGKCLVFNSDSVIHVADFPRFRQVRGASQLLTSLKLMTKLTKYLDDELTSADVAAKWAMYIKRRHGLEQADVNSGNDVDLEDLELAGGSSTPVPVEDLPKPEYDRLEKITAGSIEYLEPGDEIGEIGGSKRPNAAFKDYVRAMIRIFGAGNSLPLEMIMLDFSDSNFSSNKAAMLLAWTYIIVLQTWFDKIYCRPLAKRSLSWGMENGLFTLPDKWQYYIGFTAPGLPEIDRGKAETAKGKALENETTTLKREVASQGGAEDWRDMQQQRHEERMNRLDLIKKEKEYCEKNGLTKELENYAN